MFCEYCGEIIKDGITKCPCCGARVSGDINSTVSSPTMLNNADDYYKNLNNSSTNYTSTYTSPNDATYNASNTAVDIVKVVLSVMFPIVGIIFGIRFMKRKQTAFGIICLIFGILQSLSFFLPFILVFIVGIIDSSAILNM